MKKTPRYDIFISYRRKAGAQYARTLQLILEKKGFRVFLDYDELLDDEFPPQIEAALRSTPVYIIVLTHDVFDRCSDPESWVRRELELAIESDCHIVPVNPDNDFSYIPDDVPDHIRRVIENTQHSEVNFGQTLEPTIDMMVRNRIRPHVGNRKRRKLTILLSAIALIVITVLSGLFIVMHDRAKELETLKNSITFAGRPIGWSDGVTAEQVRAIGEILANMEEISGGSFMMGALPDSDGSFSDLVDPDFETPAHRDSVGSFYLNKFEVTTGQWNAIIGDHGDRREEDPSEPVASVTYQQVSAFIDSLNNLTMLDFRLPTEAEWEYAAKGGDNPEGFRFAGSDDPAEVAWYSANSGSHANSSPRPTATYNNIFNLSGNVSEWTSSKFVPYNPEHPINDENAIAVRGGNFDSEPYELTVTHREPTLPDTSLSTLGFRLAHSK